MTLSPNTGRRLIQAAAALMLIVAAPLAFTSKGVEVNNACAQSEVDTGTCCTGSGTCVIGNYIEHGAYYKATGPC
jgi:hypothetical protein